MTQKQLPRIDHITTQYIWALENEQVFMTKAKHAVKQGHFNIFRDLVVETIRPIRRLVGDNTLPGVEWAFLYMELWVRLDGFNILMSNLYYNPDVKFQLDRLDQIGLGVSRKGVIQRTNKAEKDLNQYLQGVTAVVAATDALVSTNPCAEILLGQPQFCALASEPEKEEPMSNTVEIKTITYINNADVTKLSDEQLIDAIKTIENEIVALKAVKTKSTKITIKINEALHTLAKVVAILDGR
jgi:hypothetical protein